MTTVRELQETLSQSTNEKSRAQGLEQLLSFIHGAVDSNEDDDEDPVFQGNCELASLTAGAITASLKKSLMVEEIANISSGLECLRAITDDVEDEAVIRSFAKGGDLASCAVDVLSESMLASDDPDDEEELEKMRWTALVCDILNELGAIEGAIDLGASSKTKKLGNLLISSPFHPNSSSSAIEALSDISSQAAVLIKAPNFVDKLIKVITSIDTSTEDGAEVRVFEERSDGAA